MLNQTSTFEKTLKNFLYLSLIGFSIIYFIFYSIIFPSHQVFIIQNNLSPHIRNTFFLWLLIGSMTTPVLAGTAYSCYLKRRFTPLRANFLFQKWVYRLRPLGLLFTIPILFNQRIWSKHPIFLFLVAFIIFFFLARWIFRSNKSFLKSYALSSKMTWVILFLIVGLYAAYVSIYTIQAHYALETRAFDLGVFENILWNTLHGNFMNSSLELSGNHLGIHTSFILLVLLPIFWLFPHTETLLISQSIVMALAAWPLFLVTRHIFKQNLIALLIALAYLIHPAIGGANFYDFHELAFSPFLFFFSFYFWLLRKSLPFWIFILLLLLVKEDMAIVIFLFGLFSLVYKRFALGFQLIIVGFISFVILQHIIIPYFAGGDHSYAWYFKEMIPHNEGPLGLIKTILINPLYSLQYFFSPPKMFYLFQLLAPILFLCFFSLRGWILISYGLLLSLGASKEPMYQLGFQYPLQILPFAFIGALLKIEQLPKRLVAKQWMPSQKQIFFLILALSLLTSFHYGMIYPRNNLHGGYRIVDFDYTAEERSKSHELSEFMRLIPEYASVTASENLVPHVAQRFKITTLRYAHQRGGANNDFFLVFNRHIKNTKYGNLDYVFDEIKYDLIKESKTFSLYAKKEKQD